jgi:uncharacterized protein YhaN
MFSHRSLDASTPPSVVEALAELRRELQDKLRALAEERVAPERELERLDKAMDSTRRMLELVQATEEQLAAQGQGQPDLEGGGAGASTHQVSWSAKLQRDIQLLPTWGVVSML